MAWIGIVRFGVYLFTSTQRREGNGQMKWLFGLAGLILGSMMGRFENGLQWMVMGFLAGGAYDFFRPRRDPAAGIESIRALQERVRRIEESLVDLRNSPDALRQPQVAERSEDIPAQADDTDRASAGAIAAEDHNQLILQGVETPAVQQQAMASSDMAVAQSSVPQAASSVPPAVTLPNPIESAWRWFWSGNTVVKAGVVILFFGVAFLIKYAADNALLPIELRLAAVAAIAIAMLVLGWRLAQRHADMPDTNARGVDNGDVAAAGIGADSSSAGDGAVQRMKYGYGLLLQGAAVGILYLTVFGAFRVYGLLPGVPAFALMIAIVLLAAVLAVKQDSLALAAFGSAGGFLAPILASTGGGSHIGLFSFYALLNAGILVIAWYRSWRVLNLLGFVFTFAIGAMWGAKAYRPEHFATTEPFLILFFLFYVAIAVIYALRQAPQIRSYVDGTLVFGTPIVAFSLQAALVKDMSFATAFSAVAVSAIYLGLAAWLKRRSEETLSLLIECFVALGVVFLTMAVPLALDGRWTAAVWAVEGAAVAWVGLRQRRLLARAFGYVVMLGAAIAFLADFENWRGAEDWALLNAAFIGRLLIAVSALFVARIIDAAALAPIPDDRPGDGERFLALFFSLWGGVWWLNAGIGEIAHWLAKSNESGAIAVFLALSALAAAWVSRRFEWNRIAGAVPVLLPLLAIDAVYSIAENGRPFTGYGWLAWPLAMTLHYVLLCRHERVHAPNISAGVAFSWFSFLHALGVWLITVLAVSELHHLTTTQALGNSVWSAAAAVIPLVCMVLWLTSARAARRWPVRDHIRAYYNASLTPLVVLSWLWIFYADSRYDGAAGPLPYLPLLNALDLMHAFIGISMWCWWRAFARAQIDAPMGANLFWSALGAAVFFWFNAVLLRSIHHWAEIPYRLESLMHSMLVQASLSIFWTMLAWALMFIAHRYARRILWMTGAVLMGAVVAKLFLIDLSNVGGVERIVSFIVVGLLMLAIGYFSPRPPKSAAKAPASSFGSAS